jgi:hypothetical protein
LIPLRNGRFFGLVCAENYARGGRSILLGVFKRGWVAAALLLAASDFPTVRFYDRSGRSVGTTTTYSGGQTKVYDERGRLVGTAARRPK